MNRDKIETDAYGKFIRLRVYDYIQRFRLIEPGSFLMGSPEGKGKADEHPQHEVKIEPFYLGCYPVTNEEYERFLQANPDVQEPKYLADRRFNPKRRPVVGVSWRDAKRFCEWSGGRLPSEAEWEYAARAGTTTDYWWGDDPGRNRANYWWGDAPGTNHANYMDSGSSWRGKQTSPVGLFEPNPFGLYDTAGNVWEWVQDAWHDDYQGAPIDGSAWDADYANGVNRVLRGGSWLDRAGYVRSACRFRDGQGTRYDFIGFRLALDQFKGCENE